jgi:hypothetical protein
VASQAVQAAPPPPQVDNDGSLHSVPWQQPPAHDEASHTHAPFMQRWPVWQAGPPPQRQAPMTAQVSALSLSQMIQAAAPVPQVVTDRG